MANLSAVDDRPMVQYESVGHTVCARAPTPALVGHRTGGSVVSVLPAFLRRASARSEKAGSERPVAGDEAVENALWPELKAINPVGTGPENTFAQVAMGVRVGTTLLALVLASPSMVHRDWSIIIWSSVVLAYNLFRVVQPIRPGDDRATFMRLMFDLALHTLAVVSTGAWSSPFGYPLLGAVILVGLLRGFTTALGGGLAVAVIVSGMHLSSSGFGSVSWRTNAQWSIELVLVAVMAGYARRISGDATLKHSAALHRLDQLADANSLLSSLHQVAQSLPASLDLEESLDSTMARIRELFRFDAAALLLFDETDGEWIVARWDGARLPAKLLQRDMIPPLRRAAATRRVISAPDLMEYGGGLTPKAASGLYGALSARDGLIGLLAMESAEPHGFADRDVELLDGFLEPAALALDNARVFSRLRTVGADEERTRIARDLHDRIGQSLAYLAFELDRIVKRDSKGDSVSVALEQLRGDLRGVIGEVRDTLYDLRTDVSDDSDLPTTMEVFLKRVQDRSGLEARLISRATGRLPLLQEREFWRVAQEAVMNVERHAKASSVVVAWRCDGRQALLEVIDDGKGFPKGRAGRLDSYGIMGMRERAASIGATLDINGAEGRGTIVRCRLTGS